jgi:hypothetical protein
MRIAEAIIIGVSIACMIATTVWTAEKKSVDIPYYRVYRIPAGTFDLDVDIIVTEDTAFAAKYIITNFDSSIKTPDLDARAVTFGTANGKPPIIWFSDIEDTAIVQHELLHVTIDMMKWAGIELNDQTEEVYTYQLQYLTKQFYKQVNQKK